MRCTKCGAELPTDASFCNNCGAKVDISADVDILEDDYLKSILEKDAAGKDELGDEIYGGARRKASEAEKKNKKKKIIIIIIACAISAAAILITLTFAGRSSDPDYLYRQALSAYENRNYTSAQNYAERTLALEPDNLDALFIYGASLYGLGEYENATEPLYTVCRSDADNLEAYRMLLEIYKKNEDYESISALKGLTTEEDVIELIESYMIPTPVISTESGSFDEYISVVITVSGSDYRIFYTLDGTDPTESSKLYSEPVKIEEEGEITLKAVTADKGGNLSEVSEAVYTITIAAPAQPTISPTSGTFTEETYISVSAESGCDIYYTWDGSEPTTSSDKAGSSIKVPTGNNILSVIAVNKEGKASEVLKASFAYYPETQDTGDGTDGTETQQETGTTIGDTDNTQTDE